jgi:hypothetical protein
VLSSSSISRPVPTIAFRSDFRPRRLYAHTTHTTPEVRTTVCSLLATAPLYPDAQERTKTYALGKEALYSSKKHHVLNENYPLLV